MNALTRFFPLCLIVMLVSCDSIHESPDFVRHQYSRVMTPYDRTDVIYFDVKFDPSYPENNEAAEAVRMEWLAAWLEARNMCVYGFDIVKRRPFDAMEDNPARYDSRYEVACGSPPLPVE
jgi:hypothetical protein